MLDMDGSAEYGAYYSQLGICVNSSGSCTVGRSLGILECVYHNLGYL